MSKSTISIYVLIILLVGTNSMWLLSKQAAAPSAITPTPIRCIRTDEADEIYNSVVYPLIGAIAAAAKPGASRESIIQSANSADIETNAHCTGMPWVDSVRSIGLQFNEAGRLIGATSIHCKQ